MELVDDYDTPEKRVKAWNEWRSRNGDIEINLRGANLEGAELCNINLSNADLEGTNFYYANLKHASLPYANLTKANCLGASLAQVNFANADLSKTDFEQADLRGATFSRTRAVGVDLSHAHLEETDLNGTYMPGARMSEVQAAGADLYGVRLEGADLTSANLESANLSHAKLARVDLTGANLKNVNLRNADLDEAILHSAKLENADLRGSHRFEFDDNYIRNCITSANCEEPWLVLRRTYTNARVLFFLFLFTLFLLPYVAKTLWWVGVNETQSLMLERYAKKQASLQGRIGFDPLSPKLSDERLSRLNEAERFELFAFREVRDYVDLGKDWQPWLVGELVLSFDKGRNFALTAVAIVLYNFSRLFLTLRISRLRDHEEMVGVSPALKTARRAFRWHRLVQVLGIVAIGSGVIHIFDWLTRLVWLPG